MKIERLLAITNYLLSNKRVTGQTLSNRFQVSTRTIMRDINTLSLAGIPVVTYYGSDGGDLSYTNASSEERVYEVEPVATMYKWYNWYLLCYYPKYGDYRIYKLVRMGELSLTGSKNDKLHMAAEAKRQWELSEQKQRKIKVKLLCKNSIRVKCEEYLTGGLCFPGLLRGKCGRDCRGAGTWCFK